jgi:hypothetical protein
MMYQAWITPGSQPKMVSKMFKQKAHPQPCLNITAMGGRKRARM